MSQTSSPYRFIVACLVAFCAVTGLAQPPDIGRVDVAESTRISSQIEEARAALDQQRAELAALRHAKSTLDERMRWVERRARVNALGGEFSQTLMDYLGQLPGPERFRALRDQHAEQMAAASDEELRVERVLHEIKAGQRCCGMKSGAPLRPPAAPAGEVSGPRAARCA